MSKHRIFESFFDDENELDDVELNYDNRGINLFKESLFNAVSNKQVSFNNKDLLINEDDIKILEVEGFYIIYINYDDEKSFVSTLCVHDTDYFLEFLGNLKVLPNYKGLLNRIFLGISRTKNKGKERLSINLQGNVINCAGFLTVDMNLSNGEIRCELTEDLKKLYSKNLGQYSYNDSYINYILLSSSFVDNISLYGDLIQLSQVENLKDLDCILKCETLYIYSETGKENILSFKNCCRNINSIQLRLETSYDELYFTGDISPEYKLFSFEGIPNIKKFSLSSSLKPTFAFNHISFEGFDPVINSSEYILMRFKGLGREAGRNYIWHFGKYKSHISTHYVEFIREKGEDNPLLRKLIDNVSNNDYYMQFYNKDSEPKIPYTGNLDSQNEKIMAKKQKINQLKEQLKKKISEEIKLGSIVYGKKLFKNKWITNKTKPFIFVKHFYRGAGERWVIYYLEDKNKELFTKYGEFIPVPELRYKYVENQEFRNLNKIYAKSLTLSALLELVKSEHIYPELTEEPIVVEPKEEHKIDFDKKLEDKEKKVSEKKPMDKPKLNIDIVDYSAAAIALFGDTYKIKTELKTLGARWNNKLKVNGEIKAGWILPKSKKEKVKNIIKNYKEN